MPTTCTIKDSPNKGRSRYAAHVRQEVCADYIFARDWGPPFLSRAQLDVDDDVIRIQGVRHGAIFLFNSDAWKTDEN